MNFSIRDAEQRDLPEIVEIYNSTVESEIVTADTERITVDSRLNWFKTHSPGHRPLWVVTHNNQIAGWLSFHSFYGRPAYSITAELGIYIHEDFRGRGLGKLLLKKAIQQAPFLQLENLVGFIFSDNIPSLHLFRQEGFNDWGQLPKVAKFGEKYQDLIIVGLKIK